MGQTEWRAAMDTSTIKKSKTELVEKRQPAQLQCSGCGATVDAACDCGLPYERAGVVAAKAVAAHPEKSNYAIAEETGTSEYAVREARKRVTIKNVTGTKRIGKDGKSYPATKPKKPLPMNKGELRRTVYVQGTCRLGAEQAYFDRVEKAVALAAVPYNGNVNDAAIELARGVAKVWNELADKLEKQRGSMN
jgi:hypothetical protein